ncbi:hypothetical protein [Ferruginibacter sp.]
MIYTNDETDRKRRTRDVYATVVALPLCLLIVLCCIIYFIAAHYHISKPDTGCLYFIAAMIAIMLGGYFGRDWLKMPDNTYHNIKQFRLAAAINAAEPQEYEVVYYPSVKSSIIVLLFGIVILAMAIYFFFIQSESLLIPGAMLLFGAFVLYASTRNIFFKKAILKLTKEGLWTKRSGFVDWKQVINAQVAEEKNGNNIQLILEIFIKGTVQADAGVPNEKLNITDVAGSQFIQMRVDELLTKRLEAGQ